MDIDVVCVKIMEYKLISNYYKYILSDGVNKYNLLVSIKDKNNFFDRLVSKSIYIGIYNNKIISLTKLDNSFTYILDKKLDSILINQIINNKLINKGFYLKKCKISDVKRISDGNIIIFDDNSNIFFKSGSSESRLLHSRVHNLSELINEYLDIIMADDDIIAVYFNNNFEYINYKYINNLVVENDDIIKVMKRYNSKYRDDIDMFIYRLLYKLDKLSDINYEYNKNKIL